MTKESESKSSKSRLMDIKDYYIKSNQSNANILPYHNGLDPGIRYLAINNSVFSKSPIHLSICKLDRVSQSQPDYVDEHIHSVDSLYVFIGEGEEIQGLTALIRMGDQEIEVESPGTMFIPAGIRHSCKITGGHGIFLTLVLSGDYEACTFGQ